MRNCIMTGLGGRGLYWHGQLKGRDDVEIAAYVEPAAANRERAVEHLGISADSIYPSLDQALAASKPDFILDVTPPAVHHQIAAAAFDAGLHLLSEKPLSDNIQTARQVAAMGQRAGVKHMITQNYRFNPFVRSLRQLLGAGLIGQPGQCDVQFHKAWADDPGSFYVTEPYMVINDMMVHHFDLMRYLLGVEPVSVQAITWNQPWGWHAGDSCHAIVFEFPGGLHATHVTVGCSVGQSPRDFNGNWRFDGPKGSITWSDNRLHHVHQHRVDWPINQTLVPTHPAGDIVTEFIAAIDADRQPECNAQDNLQSMAMVFAAIKSAQEKRKVLLEEVFDG